MRRALHKLLKKVGEDVEALKFNTAIAAMMEFVNLAEKEGISAEEFRTFLVVLSPFAPHVAEELWQKLQGAERGGTRGVPVGLLGVPARKQGTGSVTQQSWPSHDPELIREKEVTVVVQVDGRVRDEILVPVDSPDVAVRARAEASAKVQRWLVGRHSADVIVVPNRLVNFVTKKGERSGNR